MQLAHSRHAVNRSADQQAEATAAAATAAGSAAVAATGSAAAWHAKRARMIRLCLHSFRTLRGALKHDQTAAVNTPVKSRLRDGGRSSRAQAPDGRLNGELSMGRVLQRVPRLQSKFEPWNRLSKSPISQSSGWQREVGFSIENPGAPAPFRLNSDSGRCSECGRALGACL